MKTWKMSLTNSFGVPVFHSTEQFLKHVNKKQGMDYNDEHYGSSKIKYDGKLIDLTDGSLRYRRDKARQHMYEWSEDQLDESQLTFEDIKKHLKD